MRRTRLLELVVLLLLTPAALACLWDYDTLAAEARGRPGVAEVLVGWIDRWPDEVYEERIERREALVVLEPGNLEAFDDLGVACDRLGRCDEAIAWMARKRAALDALDKPDETHEYRYHANLGTFHVHRWIASGADRTEMADVEAAREHIAKAIEINPEAHFGREKVQLELIRMLLSGEHVAADSRDAAWTDGLLGLVELGNAWESMDVFAQLHNALLWEHGALAALAKYRVDELRDAGRRPMLDNWDKLSHAHQSDHGDIELYLTIGGEVESDARAWFTDARAAADARNDARDAYIRQRLESGVHPDDVEWDVFFAGWTEPSVPELPDSFLPTNPFERALLFLLVAVTVIVAVVVAAVYVIRKAMCARVPSN